MTAQGRLNMIINFAFEVWHVPRHPERKMLLGFFLTQLVTLLKAARPMSNFSETPGKPIPPCLKNSEYTD